MTPLEEVQKLFPDAETGWGDEIGVGQAATFRCRTYDDKQYWVCNLHAWEEEDQGVVSGNGASAAGALEDAHSLLAERIRTSTALFDKVTEVLCPP